MSDADTRRGQIEGVGVVLLTALVVVAISTFGVFYLGSLGDDAEPRVALDVRLTPAAGNVTVTVVHGGGIALDTDEMLVVLRDDGGNETRATLSEGSLSGSTPATFDAGEAWTYTWNSTASYADGDRLRVLVVHDATASVPFDSPVTIDEKESGALAPKYEPPTAVAGGGSGGGAGGGDGGAGGGGGAGAGDGGAGGGDGGAGGDGTRDPGSAYLDYDGNRLYDSGTADTKVDLTDNDNGDVAYSAPSGPMLVVPDSVSGGELRARNGKVRLEADSVDVDVGLTSTTSTVDVVARSGAVYVGTGDTLSGQNGAVTIDAGGDIVAHGATFDSDTSAVSLTGAAMALGGAIVDARNGPITVDASGDVDANGTRFDSATSSVEIAGATLDLAAATVDADNNAVRIDASGDVSADDAILSSGTSTVDVSGNAVHLRNAIVTSDSNAVSVDAMGPVEAAGTTVFRSANTLSITGTSIDVRDGSLESTNRGLTLTATAGDIDIRDADLATASQWQDAVADVTGAGTVSLGGFKLTGDKRLDIRPDGTYTPQSSKYKNKVE